MKTAKSLSIILLVSLFSFSIAAQDKSQNKNESLKVQGLCSMCKTRIEKAAKIEGVESALWDSKTQLLTLNYNPSKTSADAVAKKVAGVGHDTEKYKAEDKVYNALPACCKYRSEKTSHEGHTH